MEILRFLPFAAAAVVLLIGVFFYVRNRSRLQRGQIAVGKVVGSELSYQSGATYYTPHVQFATHDGRTITFVSRYGVRAQPALGHAVNVLYDPEKPERAELKHSVASQHAPLVCLICAVVFSIGGLPIILR